jgi:hypothetical protein
LSPFLGENIFKILLKNVGTKCQFYDRMFLRFSHNFRRKSRRFFYKNPQNCDSILIFLTISTRCQFLPFFGENIQRIITSVAGGELEQSDPNSERGHQVLQKSAAVRVLRRDAGCSNNGCSN